MLRRFSMLAAVALIPAAIASAQFRQGDFELTLSGTGSNGPNFNGTTFAINGNLGYFVTDNLELGIRQSLGFTDLGPGSAWSGSTRIAVDWNFDLGKWVPYVGVNIGYVYGDAVRNTWEAAPEAGIKYFVNSTTFIQLGVEYQFFFDQHSSGGHAFSNGEFVYGLGIGFKFKP